MAKKDDATADGRGSRPSITLKVPPRFWEAFRAAVVVELLGDIEDLPKDFRTLCEHDLSGYPEEQWPKSWAAYREEFCYVEDMVRLLDDVLEVCPPPETPEYDMGVSGTAEAIYHVLHEMVSKFTSSLTTEAISSLPPEPEGARTWMAATEWALAELEKAGAVMNGKDAA